MNCKNCGKEIELIPEGYSKRYKTSYQHKEVLKYISCSYANGLGVTSDLYPYPQVVATPDDKEGGAGSAFLVPIPTPVCDKLSTRSVHVVSSLPVIHGRKFRQIN
jgi:hypothetical protein